MKINISSSKFKLIVKLQTAFPQNTNPLTFIGLRLVFEACDNLQWLGTLWMF